MPPRRHGDHGESTEGTHLEESRLSEQIIGAAIEVHRLLGPGMLESAYEACLCHELQLRGLEYEAQVDLALNYKGLIVPHAYRIDLIVSKRVVVEIKAVDGLDSVHEAQLLTYLRLTGIKVGLLINFNHKLLKDGVVRRVL